MSAAPVALDFSKAEPLKLDFSKAEPLPQQGGGAPTQAAPPQQSAPPQAAQPQQGAPPTDAAAEPQGGTIAHLLGIRSLSDLLPDSPTTIMNRVGHSASEAVHNMSERVGDAHMGVTRSLTTGANNVESFIRDKTGTHLLDKDIDSNEQFLRATAPKNKAQQEGYSAGDEMGGMLLAHWLSQGLSAFQIAKNMKVIPVLTKLATENPHIAKIIGAGLREGTANAAATGAMGGSLGDMANAGMTATVLGAAGEAPGAHADYLTKTADKYKPTVTDIGGQKFIEVSKAASDKGITTQEQETGTRPPDKPGDPPKPSLQEANRQSYETLRDKGIRERAAQGTAETVNAMEPTQPPVSVAGAQRIKAKTSVSTAPPEKPITNAKPREIELQQRFLQKVIDSKKMPQKIKDRAQAQFDKIESQKQAVEDWKNNPDNFRTETKIDPKVLLQNSENFGEFAEEVRRHAERRVQDMQWHQRQYDSNGKVKLDASGNEVWKPVDVNKMSRTERDGAMEEGDLSQRDVRGLSKTDVKQGQRLGRIAEAAQKLDETTQKIYDLSRERAESVKTQTGQPNLRQERRTTSMQTHINELEALAKEYGPEFKDMFGRKDGITDLIAAAQKISYGENGQKYSGTLGNYFLQTLKKRSSMTGKDSFGMGMWAVAKGIGLKHTAAALIGEAATEAAHRRFMHRVATDPDYANAVLTKDRSPVKGIRFTARTLANLGTQVSVREGVSQKVQSGEQSSQEGID